MTQPFGLQPDDLAEVMATFGVAEAQVRRDHAISHILAALSGHHGEELIFFGGAALSRTYLLDQRLSEDIDLIAVDHRDGLVDVLLKEVSSALARAHGRITWSPGWSRNSDVDPAVAVTAEGIAIQIQLLRGAGGAARDLYDLWALDKVGALNPESAALFARHGPTSSPPRSWMFKRAPSAVEWQAQLGGQTRLKVIAAEALAAVRTGWAVAVCNDWE